MRLLPLAFPLLVGLLGGTSASGEPVHLHPDVKGEAPAAEPQSDPRLARLPPGRVRTLLFRLPPDQLRAIIMAARADLQELDRREREGVLTPEAAARELEETLGLRTALIIAGSNLPRAAMINPPFQAFSSSEFVTAAYASDAAGSAVSSTLRQSIRREAIDTLIDVSPWIFEPANPCTEGTLSDPRRLEICVDRGSFKSVAGIAWDGPSGPEIECSAQFLSDRFLVTADHCFLEHGSTNPVVTTHFTGGTSRAKRKVDGREFARLSFHAVKKVHRRPSSPRSGSILRDYDVAVIELESAAPVDKFPRRAAAFPANLKMAAAGWGLADAAPVNEVALEVTMIVPTGPDLMTSDPPTLKRWPATLTSGGGICRGDSGGPIFAGNPSGQNPATLPLLGLVAGGNIDCQSGQQALTDLTRAETRDFICLHALLARYC